MKKVFVIDTNVILSDADCIFKFDEHEVIIPQPVLSELDTKKREQNEVGRNARTFSRHLDNLRSKGNILQGVKVNDKDGILKVITYNLGFERYLPYQDMKIKDNMILACALSIPQTTDVKVILVSNDTNMRINADIFGVEAESYKNDKVIDDVYTGIQYLEVPQLIIDRVYVQKKLMLSDIIFVDDEPYPNECFVLYSAENHKQSALVRYDGVLKEFNLLPQDLKTVDILPRNTEQQFALDLLKDETLNLVTINGLAGSGKTIVSLAAGLDAVLNKQQYAKIMLFKPIIAMDNSHELGFLPGSMIEKLGPWMASYSDNLERIMQGYMRDERPKKKKTTKKEEEVFQEKQVGKTNPVHELMELGLLEMGSLEHLRGRSLSNCYIIIDEVQNCSLSAVKTILTRAGDNTKIVLLADIDQIDSPYLDSQSNGFTRAVEAFKNQQISGHIAMRKSERSKLAEISATIL